MKTESILALAAGLAAGFVLGVMYAPEKGERNRKKIREAAEEACDAVEKASNDFRAELKQMEEDLQNGEIVEPLEG